MKEAMSTPADENSFMTYIDNKHGMVETIPDDEKSEDLFQDSEDDNVLITNKIPSL